MTFLPVVVRELRVAVRRPSTYRLRVWTVILAAVVSLGALVLVGLSGSRGGAGGKPFSLLSHYAFGLCLLAGGFLTADCLSAEKRDGTLGLLFLTDLKGFDVVLGKFAATSLSALYGLFALLPVLGLPLLLGGITGAEFWRTALALANALFFSLTAGICVSAFAREAQGAMGRTLGLVLGLTAGLPILAKVGASLHPSPAWNYVGWPSPFQAFAYAAESLYFSRAKEYWGGLIVSHLLGWVWLGVASVALPARWRDASGADETRSGLGHWLWSGGRHRRAGPGGRRSQLLCINPVLWLIGDNASMQWAVWSVVGLWGVAVAAGSWFSPTQPLWAYQGAKVAGFLLKVLLAVQACRFFTEARRDGTLELLLCTPVASREIVQGQWLALRRLFLPPLITFLVLNLIPIIFLVVSSVGGGQQAVHWGSAVAGLSAGLVALGWFTFSLVADAFAVCWFGMWLAFSMKRPGYAPAVVILAVLVVPSFFCFLDLIADLVFILWGYTKLQQDFRRLSLATGQAV